MLNRVVPVAPSANSHGREERRLERTQDMDEFGLIEGEAVMVCGVRAIIVRKTPG